MAADNYKISAVSMRHSTINDHAVRLDIPYIPIAEIAERREKRSGAFAYTKL